MSLPSAELEAALVREQPALLTYAFRLLGRDADAHDCVQDAVLKAWEAVRAGSMPIQWRPWLFRLTHNAAVDRLRRRGVEARARREARSSTPRSQGTSADLEELLVG